MPTPLSSNMLALTTARVRSMRIGAFRVGFAPRDTRTPVPGIGRADLYLWARAEDLPLNVLTTALQDVIWADLVGCRPSGNNLTRYNASNGWTAGAASAQKLVSGDGYVEITLGLPDLDNAVAIGLSNENYGPGLEDIDFALVRAVNGGLFQYESGVNVGFLAFCSAGDVLRVGIEGGLVKYRKNGALLATAVPTPVYPIRADASLFSPAATILGAKFVATINPGQTWTTVQS
jgi:hypothetical protein